MKALQAKTPLAYSIGKSGVPWAKSEKELWLSSRKVRRSYLDEVVSQIKPLCECPELELVQYGSLSPHLPLYAAKPRVWDQDKPSLLVTGGVHGYETSGVMGAVRFLLCHALSYTDAFNVVVAPCVSPWGFETVERWNSKALDPNRSFVEEEMADRTEEGDALVSFLESLGEGDPKWLCHVDLHETTDTDVSEFRPARAAHDGLVEYSGSIPDGFYLVGDSDAEVSQEEFLGGIIDSVRKITHIAEPDDDGLMCGEPVVQHGVISIPSKKVGICASVTGAVFCTTTEVYPDSPRTSDEECIKAQLAAVKAAFNYVAQYQTGF